jgi:flagellin-specific chaperone FliS
MGIFTTISKLYSMLYETSRELFKTAKSSIEMAKIKRMLTKVIKENTIDV